MIRLSDTDYVKIANGLIRLQELDSLYKLCQDKVANADSQIVNYEEIITNHDTIISRYEGLTDSLRVNLYLAKREARKQKKLIWGISGAAVIGWLVAIFRRS
jgi:hypothetical protein